MQVLMQMNRHMGKSRALDGGTNAPGLNVDHVGGSRFCCHPWRMRKLLLLLPALALVSAPSGALTESVLAEDLPARRNEWTKAPPIPFPQTPEGFKVFVNSRDFGIKILKAEQCKYIKFPAKVTFLSAAPMYGEPGKELWSREVNYYSCDRTFYESSDPRGVQRCMGKAWYQTRGTTPDRPNPGEAFNHKTLKNDCRWL